MYRRTVNVEDEDNVAVVGAVGTVNDPINVTTNVMNNSDSASNFEDFNDDGISDVDDIVVNNNYDEDEEVRAIILRQESRKQRYNHNQTLLELGRNSSFNASKLSKSTIDSVISHINLLKFNNVEISRENLTGNTIKILDSLRDRRGDKLSSSYKLQIGMTIKRMYRNAPVNLKKYNKDRYTTPTRVSSSSFMASIKKIIDAASRVIAQADEELTDLGMHDASLAVLFSSTTSLRIFEISQLKMSDIHLIMTNEAVNIRSKAHVGARKIALNDTLLALLKAVERQRPAVRECLTKKKNDPRYSKKLENFYKDYILLSSTSYMRKKLKELAASFLTDTRIKTLGFNSFRKYITTILVNSGAHEIAQTLNNHSSLDTTLNNYYVQSAESVEKMNEKIDEMARSMMPSSTKIADSERTSSSLSSSLLPKDNKGDKKSVSEIKRSERRENVVVGSGGRSGSGGGSGDSNLYNDINAVPSTSGSTKSAAINPVYYDDDDDDDEEEEEEEEDQRMDTSENVFETSFLITPPNSVIPADSSSEEISVKLTNRKRFTPYESRRSYKTIIEEDEEEEED